MGERGVRNAEVEGSNPLPSTNQKSRVKREHELEALVNPGARYVGAG